MGIGREDDFLIAVSMGKAVAPELGGTGKINELAPESRDLA